jgi:hypothetical protein
VSKKPKQGDKVRITVEGDVTSTDDTAQTVTVTSGGRTYVVDTSDTDVVKSAVHVGDALSAADVIAEDFPLGSVIEYEFPGNPGTRETLLKSGQGWYSERFGVSALVGGGDTYTVIYIPGAS